ncbi:hypothetical protein D3C75_1094100 [compost metagenome]
MYGKKVMFQDRHQWQLDFWVLLRSTLRNTGSLTVIREELLESIKHHLDNQNQEDAKNGPGAEQS